LIGEYPMPFQLNPLPYAYDALEPFIDTMTMQIHHDKHHAAYVNNLNVALEKHPELAGKPVEILLKELTAIPEDIRTAVRNHGGGTWNHDLFWQVMAPKGGGEPRGGLEKSISASFGSFANFKTEFEKTAMGRFGSGWTWLVQKGEGLVVVSSANQDNPLSDGFTPILGLDVWEHAYYLKYQNRRADYISGWWNVVNWAEVARRYSAK
jgi:Fe-Mn family superoxide dismutase